MLVRKKRMDGIGKQRSRTRRRLCNLPSLTLSGSLVLSLSLSFILSLSACILLAGHISLYLHVQSRIPVLGRESDI